jgi:hypothetical protein
MVAVNLFTVLTLESIYLIAGPKKLLLPKRVLDASQVTQIDVLEEYQLLLVLSNKTISSYPMEALDSSDNQSPSRRGLRRFKVMPTSSKRAYVSADI